MGAHARGRALAAVHHRRELRLLRRLGLALLLPARLLDRVEPGLRARHPRPPSTRARASSCSSSRSPGTSACSATSSTTTSSSPRRTTSSRSPASTCPSRRGRSSSRSASPSSRSWGSATSSTSTAATSRPSASGTFAAYLSFFPHLVAGPIVRPGRAHPAVPVAARPALRRHLARVLPHRHRAVHEGRDRELPRREHRRRGLRRAEPALVARGARRDLRLRRADLRRLLRLHEHRDRDRAPARASRSRRTSTRRTRRPRSRTSGAAGT